MHSFFLLNNAQKSTVFPKRCRKMHYFFLTVWEKMALFSRKMHCFGGVPPNKKLTKKTESDGVRGLTPHPAGSLTPQGSGAKKQFRGQNPAGVRGQENFQGSGVKKKFRGQGSRIWSYDILITDFKVFFRRINHANQKTKFNFLVWRMESEKEYSLLCQFLSICFGRSTRIFQITQWIYVWANQKVWTFE